MSRSGIRNRRHGDLHTINEINVMPLVDLLLQLFIAVVIFFPVVEYGMNINLPKGTTDTIKREQTRTLSVDRFGRVYLNDIALTPRQLQAQLASLAMEVLTQLHAAHITRIALMTQEDTPPRLTAPGAALARR
jgi:biopolymer transport protein ExbD